MSNLTNMVETINKLKFLTDVVSNDLVRQQFINVYNAVWKQGGEQVYERESYGSHELYLAYSFDILKPKRTNRYKSVRYL